MSPSVPGRDWPGAGLPGGGGPAAHAQLGGPLSQEPLSAQWVLELILRELAEADLRRLGENLLEHMDSKFI